MRIFSYFLLVNITLFSLEFLCVKYITENSHSRVTLKIPQHTDSAAMKTISSILLLVVVTAVAPPPTLRYAIADCLYDGDMMLMVGQSVGTSAILECVDAKSYRGLDLVCGSDGNLIEVEAFHDCPINQLVLYSTPYCVQCGVRGERGSAICVASPDSTCPVVEENDS